MKNTNTAEQINIYGLAHIATVSTKKVSTCRVDEYWNAYNAGFDAKGASSQQDTKFMVA